MKKLLLSSLVAGLCMAGSAHAVTVYQGKGLTYKLKGDWQIQLRKDTGNDQNWDIEYDDLELKNSVTYDLGDNLTAFGQLDFGFKDAAEDKQNGSDLEEAYIGLAWGDVSVAFGKMDFASDEFGVEKAYELKLDEDSFDAQGTSGDDVIKVTYGGEMFTAIASYELEAEGESSENGQYFDVFLGTEFSNIELGLAYQNMEASPSSDSVSTWGISAMYDAGFASFGADYSSIEDTSDQYNIVAVIPVAKTTKIAVGMVNIDEENGDDATEWYANVTYKFPNQKNVSVFAEIADTDEENVDLGALVGMRIKF